MGLSKRSVVEAWKLLNRVNPKANNSFIQEQSLDDARDNVVVIDRILGLDHKRPYDEWENVYMYVQDITDEQKAIFEAGRYKLGNTSFLHDPDENNITCLGFI